MSKESDETDNELRKKAKVVAEATGRKEQDVLEDLLDDGIVNLSNEDKPKDLVQQLTEAAELMNVVKKLNKDMSGNGVLNGKNNKTEVVVDTTLDGDLVDRAIESAQRKAENIKKLIITFAPVILLLTGGGMEALGVINMFEAEDEMSNDDDYNYDIYWGCTDWDASNYDPMANEDDGTCYYDDHDNENWGCTDPSAENWWEDATHDDGSCTYPQDDNCDNLQVIQNQDPVFQPVGESESNTEVVFFLHHNGGPECDGNVYVNVMISLYYDGGYQDTLEFGEEGPFPITANPQHEFGVRNGMLNGLGDGEWSVETRWKLGNGPENCCVMSDTIEIGEPEPEPVYGCTDDEADNYNNEATEDDGTCEYAPEPIEGCTDYEAENYNPEAEEDDGSCEYPPEPECEAQVNNHYRGHENNDPNSTTMIVAFLVNPDESCGEIEWTIELYQNGYEANHTRTGLTSGGEEGVSETFEDMTAGTWIPRITLEHEGEQIEQVQFWALDIVEQEPEPCEINLWGITFASNSTHAQVAYDLDCGEDDNNLPGYNVTVQFLVYEVNGTNSGPNATGPITWLESTHYIQGWIEDVRYLTLTNFTESNATHYDFYWYATWTDANGEVQYIERTWLNREINP